MLPSFNSLRQSPHRSAQLASSNGWTSLVRRTRKFSTGPLTGTIPGHQDFVLPVERRLWTLKSILMNLEKDNFPFYCCLLIWRRHTLGFFHISLKFSSNLPWKNCAATTLRPGSIYLPGLCMVCLLVCFWDVSGGCCRGCIGEEAWGACFKQPKKGAVGAGTPGKGEAGACTLTEHQQRLPAAWKRAQMASVCREEAGVAPPEPRPERCY